MNSILIKTFQAMKILGLKKDKYNVNKRVG